MLKRISKVFITIFVFLLAIVLVACKKDDENKDNGKETKNPSISFTTTSYELEVGEEVTLNPTTKDVDNPVVEYSLSAEGIVSNDGNGKFTALAAGNVTVTAKLKDLEVSASVTIKVNEPAKPIYVESITISGETSMTEGDTQTLTASVLPDNANDKSFTWKTSNGKIATVDANGLVTALKAGTVTITATANDEGGVSASIKIVIKEKQILATSINFEIADSFYVDDEATLTAVIEPSNASVKVARWSSTNPTVATVDESGKLTAIAAGKVTIVCETTDGSNLKASKQIEVKDFNGPKTVSYVGPTTFGLTETYQLSAKDFTSDAQEALEFVSYECFDDALTVSETGLITPQAEGSATLIVSVKGISNIEVSISVKIVSPLYVNKAWAGSASGASVGESLVFGTNAFDTIAAALAKATNGAFIYVAAGTYDESFTISANDISLLGPNDKVLGNDTRAEEAILTGKITLAKELKNTTIAGFKFTGNAQVVNNKGGNGSGAEPAMNLNGFKFAYNLVDTSLTSGKGVIYFVEGSSGYSYYLDFIGNKFTTSVTSTLEAFVYIDNNTHLTIENNTFFNAPAKAFYINDTDKGLGGNSIIKDNTFDTIGTNAFHANWGSPSPNLTKGYYIEMSGNTFKNVNGYAIFFGRFNNADSYDHISITGNTFTSVGTGVHFDRVQDEYHITVTKNTFTNDPTKAYFSNLWRDDTSKNAKIAAGGNIYLDGENAIEAKTSLYDADKVSLDPIPEEQEVVDDRPEALSNHIEIRFEGSGVLALQEAVELEVKYFGETEGSAPAFASSDATVASVDEVGKVTALKAGEATITVTINAVNATVSFNVIDESQNMNELLKLIALNNNGVVMNRIITLKGNSEIDQRVYGSVNNYWAGTMPTIKADYMPMSTKKYGVWDEDADGNQTTCIQAERTSTEFIVVHDTANSSKGANAKMNSDWAHHPQSDTTASWHYTVGNDGIYQVLENEKLIAWHAGDGTNWALDNNNSTTWTDSGVAYVKDRPEVTLGSDGYFYIEGQKTTVKYPTKDGVTPHLNDLGLFVIKGESGNYMIPTTWINSTYGDTICARGGNLHGVAIESCVDLGSDLWLTWEYLAKLVTQLLIKYDLTPERVAFHNNFSNKPCPKTMMGANLVNQFLKMVYVEYEVAKNYSDYTITFTSNNPDIIDNTGRVVNHPKYTTNVSYTVTVTKGSESASMTLHSLVIGENC